MNFHGIPLSVTTAIAIGAGAATAVWILSLLLKPRFQRKPLLNKSEIKLRSLLLRHIPRGLHLLSQVSYGEMLTNRSYRRFLIINAKRADFVICDREFNPVAVVEYQGAGHYGSGWHARQNAKRRDRQKRSALREAGIPLVEVPAHFTSRGVQQLLVRVSLE